MALLPTYYIAVMLNISLLSKVSYDDSFKLIVMYGVSTKYIDKGCLIFGLFYVLEM